MTCGQTLFIPMPRVGDDSQTSRLADDLAMAIHLGQFAPGAPLRELEIARANGVSRTIVRAALQRLEGQGLVEIVINKGARAARLAADAAWDMIELHARLTALAAHTAAARARPECIATISAFVECMEQIAPDSGDPGEFHRMRVGFARALFQAAGGALSARLIAAAPVTPHHDNVMADIVLADARTEAAQLARSVLRAIEAGMPDAAARAAERLVRRHAERVLPAPAAVQGVPA